MLAKHNLLRGATDTRFLVVVSVLLLGAFLCGCDECSSDGDCSGGKVCRGGECEPEEADTDTSSSDGDADTDVDTDTDADSDTVTETGTGTGDSDTDTATDTVTDTATDTTTEETCAEDSDCTVSPTVCAVAKCLGEICQYPMVPEQDGQPCESDDNPCTIDTCQVGLCAHDKLSGQPAGEQCPDDENSCTWDICYQGECGMPQDGLDCYADDNPCTHDACNSDGACVATPRGNGTPCNDESWCNGTESCQGGTCKTDEGSNPCWTGDPCWKSEPAEICEEPDSGSFLGTCFPEMAEDDTPCDDGFFCNGEDLCFLGECLSDGDPCPGSGGNPCELPDCDETNDACGFIDAIKGTPCPDAQLCDGEETCQNGTCSGAGVPFCEDYNDCVASTCTEPAVPGDLPLCDEQVLDDGEPCESQQLCGGEGTRLCLSGNCTFSDEPPCDLDGDNDFCTKYMACVTEGEGTDAQVDCRFPTDGTSFVGMLLSCEETEEGGQPSYTINTSNANNDVANYGSCGTGFNGGDIAFELDVVPGVDYTVTFDQGLSTVKEAMWLLLVTDACDPDGSCVEATDVGSISGTTPSSGKHYVVLDGKNGNRADGVITLTCE